MNSGILGEKKLAQSAESHSEWICHFLPLISVLMFFTDPRGRTNTHTHTLLMSA